jgi:hypothetical protein
VSRARDGWLRRWWPVLVPAGFSLVCVVVLAVQQAQIRELKQSIQTSSAAATPVVSTPKAQSDAGRTATAAKEAQEIDRLKNLAAQLSADIAQLEQLRGENSKLRAKLSAASNGLTPEETKAMEDAHAKAMKIQCINNLKQLGLAARVWSMDNADRYPPDLICMSNEVNTPKILVCPADPAHPIAANFGSFTMANCSYEYFPDQTQMGSEPERVLFRCPIHGSVGLCDGSVQSIDPNHPERLVQRNGKLYYEPFSYQPSAPR